MILMLWQTKLLLKMLLNLTMNFKLKWIYYIIRQQLKIYIYNYRTKRAKNIQINYENNVIFKLHLKIKNIIKIL